MNILAAALASGLFLADPAYTKPLKPGDTVEVWDRVWEEWRVFKIEAGPFGDVALRDDKFLELSMRYFAHWPWRWPGAETCAPTTNPRRR